MRLFCSQFAIQKKPTTCRCYNESISLNVFHLGLGDLGHPQRYRGTEPLKVAGKMLTVWLGILFASEFQSGQAREPFF